MRVIRRRGSLVVPLALALLVVALGVLQYRWLGQVSAAERQELRAALDRRARDFTTEFNRELGSLYDAMRAVLEREQSAGAREIGSALAAWRTTSAHPDLVSAIYEIDQANSLRRVNVHDGTSHPTPWPGALEPLRARLKPPQVETTVADGNRTVSKFLAIDVPLALASVPALVLFRPVPITRMFHATAPFGAPRQHASGPDGIPDSLPIGERMLIVVLDREYLTTSVLPAIASRHFGDGAVRVEVLDGSGRRLWTHRTPSGTALTSATADVAVGFFMPQSGAMAGEALDRRVFAASGITPSTDARVAVRVERQDVRSDDPVRLGPESWQLLVQHPAGSLDRAVQQARRRNGWLSFGILTVLAVSVALVVRNGRRAEALAAQQLDFVATVSHELRTPVAVIRSAAQNLAAGIVQAPEQSRQYGHVIETEGRRLTDMVEQVLEYAGVDAARDPSRWSSVEVGAVARVAADGCAGLAREQNAVIEVDADPDVPPFTGDERGLRRALDNLITNALRHAGTGRWVGVRVQQVTEGRLQWIRITVADKGPGIAAEDLRHVFEPFYRGRPALERQVPGSGLGLSLVKRFAALNGGRVRVSSVNGQGATFTLDLPAHRHERRSILQVRHA